MSHAFDVLKSEISLFISLDWLQQETCIDRIKSCPFRNHYMWWCLIRDPLKWRHTVKRTPARNKQTHQETLREENVSDHRLLTLGSTAQCCRISASLWVCSSCHRNGCRRLNYLPASYTPPAGSAHLTGEKFMQGHELTCFTEISGKGWQIIFIGTVKVNTQHINLHQHLGYYYYQHSVVLHRCDLKLW